MEGAWGLVYECLGPYPPLNRRRGICMRRWLLLIPALLVLPLLTSCFALIGFKFQTNFVRQGHSTWGLLTVRHGTTSSDLQKGYFFIMVGVPNNNQVVAGKTVFDVNGSFNGPTTMVRDNALQ